MKFSETFRIKDGKSTHKWNAKLGQFLTTLEDGEYECTVQPLEMSKTEKQNAYFNGIQVPVFSQKTGSTKRDCKRFLKKHYGVKYLTTDPVTGEREWELKSQGKYSIEEMKDLIHGSDEFLRYDLHCDFPTLDEWHNMSHEEQIKYKQELRQ